MKVPHSRFESHARKMGAMIDSCGVDLDRLAHDRLGLTLAEASRACIGCRSGVECERWLEARSNVEGDAEPPSFCPNSERFREFRGRV